MNTELGMKLTMKAFTASLALSLLLSLTAISARAAQPVTIDTFVRAESDTAIRNIYNLAGGLGKFGHLRTPTPLDNQPIIRMNRDTLYSGAVVDLSTPATVILPNAGGRYMTLHVVNQDHYMFAISKSGRHELTEEMVGSRYAALTVRLFVDANNSEDIAAANALQDKMKIVGGGTGTLDLPDWDQEQLKTARGALNTLAMMGSDPSRAFGTREDTDPLQHLIGAAGGWGGLPKKNAVYELEVVEKNDGTPYALTVMDVPVNAFWSITVYNADGFIDENDLGVYSYNNVTAKANDDGAISIHFGGCKDGRVNCLPISKGWNYAVRMYEPRKEILNGSWTFPVTKPVK